ncbi:MAG: MBL fold metallo-hydrolase [Actinomycetota bacterium]
MIIPRVIDTRMHGHEQITACFLVQGEQTALVETGPGSTVDTVLTELDSLGVEALDWIVLTHIHLDHAGAAGTLARRFPDARVAVHHVGAPHLVDPSKLWSSAARIYGDDMERMWGGIDPIDEDRLQVLEDGDKVDLGGRSLQAVDTPGHAYHHHSFLDDATGVVFTGDALGARLPDVPRMRPTTPPPEFHLDKAIASMRRVKELAPNEVWPTHFGPIRDIGVDAACDGAIAALQLWAGWVQAARARTRDLDEAAELVNREARAGFLDNLSEEQIERMEDTSSYWMNTWGFMRYFDKQEQ